MTMTVLIIDDSALMRRRLATLFKREGIEVTVARTALEALDLLPATLPDAVTLNFDMPASDGFAALSFLLREQRAPVILVSSKGRQGENGHPPTWALGMVGAAGPGAGSPLSDRRAAKLMALLERAAAAGGRLDSESEAEGATTGAPLVLHEGVESLDAYRLRRRGRLEASLSA